jgi:hypothetical protein
MSSIESAPAIMPATSADTFAPGGTTSSTRQMLARQLTQQGTRARASTGNSPAADTNLGSSNRADRTGST